MGCDAYRVCLGVTVATDTDDQLWLAWRQRNQPLLQRINRR
jgi:hypothetical protein